MSEKHQTPVRSCLAGPPVSEYSSKYSLLMYSYGAEVKFLPSMLRRKREKPSKVSCDSSECGGRHGAAATRAQRTRSAGKTLAHISTCVLIAVHPWSPAFIVPLAVREPESIIEFPPAIIYAHHWEEVHVGRGNRQRGWYTYDCLRAYDL